MFDHLPQSEIDIVAPDGEVRHRTKAMMTANQAVIGDATIVIEVGDEIRRKLPNGREETFEVVDPTFFQHHRSIPSHYQVKIRRKGTFVAGQGGNYQIRI